MANKTGKCGWIPGKRNSVTNPERPSEIKSLLCRFLDLLIGFWMTALKISGVCPLYLRNAKSFTFGIDAFVAYCLVFMFTLLKSLHLFAITIPLFLSTLTGSLDNFIEQLCSKQGELMAFLSGIVVALEWRSITTSIARIRRYEAVYFSQSEPRLVGLLSVAVAVAVSVWFKQMITVWKSSGKFHVGTEIAFCAKAYGFEGLTSVPVIEYLFLGFHIMDSMPMYSIAMLCAMVAAMTGRLCWRMKHSLLFRDNENISDRVFQDLLDMRNLMNSLSRQIGLLLLLFYIQSVLWLVFLINNMANTNRSEPIGSVIRDVSVVAIVTFVVTFAMTYAHDQADIAQEAQERAVLETNPRKRKNLIEYLHVASFSPAGFSLAGIIMVDRGFIGAMVGVLFTYGTFVLQLKESRNESTASPSHRLTTLCNQSLTG